MYKVNHKEWRHWHRSSVFIVNFEQISHIVLVFLLLTLNKKCGLGSGNVRCDWDCLYTLVKIYITDKSFCLTQIVLVEEKNIFRHLTRFRGQIMPGYLYLRPLSKNNSTFCKRKLNCQLLNKTICYCCCGKVSAIFSF